MAAIKRALFGLALPALAPAALALLSAFQAWGYAQNLPARTLASGRIILSPGEFYRSPDDPARDGRASNAGDGDPERAAVVPFPAAHPEGTWFLIDLALSHWPARTRGAAPESRTPHSITIWNGPCSRCTRTEFQRYSRIKRARVEFLVRRANNVDEEYVIPQAVPVWIREIALLDQPGPQTIPLDGVPPGGPSSGWPENMNYLILKITVLETYPGAVFSDRVALAETLYSDRGQDNAVKEWR
jgi:hypothetical protein